MPLSDPGAFASAAFLTLQESSDDAIVVATPDGTVVSWSRGAANIFGYDETEMVGQSLSRLWPESPSDPLAAQLTRLRIGRRIEQFETVRKAKDGRLIDVSASMSPINAANGTLAAVLVVARDIRPQKRSDEALSRSRTRWRTLLDSAVDGIVVIDARGRIEAFNQAAERLFGYSEQELLGRNVSVLMPSPYREEHDGYLARYLREGHARIIGIGRDVIARRRDGSTLPVHLSVGEMSIDGERRFTGILHDLSTRVKLEEQLREQAALAHLGEMAAVIAHEVKNPLAGIRGAVQVMAARMAPGSAERGVVGEIVSRIDALTELMADMLLFARPPKPKLAPVAVPPLIDATVDLLAADPALNGVSIEVEGSASPIPADAGLLKIVFENLLVNAAQAMKGQGRIGVSVHATADRCSIAFRDEGPGIPPEAREKVFTPFFTTKSKGTGLGLPTCKRLIDAHHGNISIACPPGGGTTVTVDLPIHP